MYTLFTSNKLGDFISYDLYLSFLIHYTGSHMSLIVNDLYRFHHALQENSLVTCNPHLKTWRVQNFFERWIYKILGFHDARIKRIVETFSSVLDSVEKDSSNMDPEKVKQIYKSIKRISPKGNHLEALAYRVTALKSRLKNVEENDHTKFDEIIALAESWKKAQPIYGGESLTRSERILLESLKKYPEFAKCLLKKKSIQHSFFEWTLGYQNNVEVFIQFPNLIDRINTSNLAGRIGRFGPDVLQIQQDDNSKIVTLPFFDGKEACRVNVLDESQKVTLNGHRILTVAEVFKVFANKDITPGDIEFFGLDGFRSWNTREFKYFDYSKNKWMKINFDHHEWWKHLPLLEILTKESVEERYGKPLESGQCLVSAKASRQTPDHVLEDQHGYMDVVIPMGEDFYAIFPFGKYLNFFPSTTWEKIKCIMDTGKARIAYPDDNTYYMMRQHASYSEVLTDDQGRQLMNLIKEEIVHSLNGNRIFQFRSENCAHWVQTILQKINGITIPNLFCVPFIRIAARNTFLSKVISTICNAPQRIQPYLLDAFELTLGSSRGVTVNENEKPTFKSVRQSTQEMNRQFFQPSALHEQISQNKLNGVVRAGPV